jgi:hypothetical protein
MNISHENVDAINAVVNVALAPEDYNPQVDKEIKAQAKKAKLPGFRPGQVPVGHIRRTYGKSILFDEINKLVNEKITNYIAENKLEVLGSTTSLEDDAQYTGIIKTISTSNMKLVLLLLLNYLLPLRLNLLHTKSKLMKRHWQIVSRTCVVAMEK